MRWPSRDGAALAVLPAAADDSHVVHAAVDFAGGGDPLALAARLVHAAAAAAVGGGGRVVAAAAVLTHGGNLQH